MPDLVAGEEVSGPGVSPPPEGLHSLMFKHLNQHFISIFITRLYQRPDTHCTAAAATATTHRKGLIRGRHGRQPQATNTSRAA